MKKLTRILILLLVTAVSPAVFAVVSVDSMNYPVWADRGGQSVPLAPGDQLRVGDVVQTGRSGRVWLAVEDGSVIKLGARARFTINSAAFRESGDETIFDAAFNVLQGAFRFTSGFFTRLREARHRIDFQVGAVTAGVRGTDIWGLSGDDKDFVALLEGSIEVSSQGDAPQFMNRPLTLYQKVEGQPADAVQAVDLAVVESLAPQTELDVQAGIANGKGAYHVVLQSLSDEGYVENALERFRNAGFAVKIRRANIGGIGYTRILLSGLADRRAADNLRDLVAREFDIADAWVAVDP